MHCSLAWPDLSSALKVITPCAEQRVWPRETMCVATAKTFTGKLSRKAENPRKPQKFSHADVLPYTVPSLWSSSVNGNLKEYEETCKDVLTRTELDQIITISILV